MTKICSMCKVEKDSDQFNKNNRSPSGLYTYCKSCAKERAAAYYVKNKAARTAYKHQWYWDNHERALAYARDYNAAESAGTLASFSVGPGNYARTYREGCSPELHDSPESWKTALNRAAFKQQVEHARLFVQQYKATRACYDCAGTFHFSAMDFDHLRAKKFNIADGVRKGYSVRKLKSEIEKCELVCSNCHRLRTWLRLQEGGGACVAT